MLTPIFHLFKGPTEQEVGIQLMLDECTQYDSLSGNRYLGSNETRFKANCS